MQKTCIFLLCFGLVSLCNCNPGREQELPDGGGDGDVGSASCDELGLRDTDGDGIPDRVEGDESVDTDGDGTPDYLDEDSDNDGHPDRSEAGMEDCDDEPRDTDFDGTPDYIDVDSDENGVLDLDESDGDLDNDGLPNWLDLDDDGDEISDEVELGSDPAVPSDVDGDGVPDFHDLDSDNDTIPDRFEGDGDMDDDGLEAFRDDDADGDTWLDIDEYGAAPGEDPVDTNGDGAYDFRDTDSDGDRLEDDAERDYGTDRTKEDTDGDSFTDYQEVQQGTNPLDGMDFPMPDPCDPSDCGFEELCGELGSGDGLDNDCNGEVDEICPCTPDEMRSCFAGPPSVRGQGACTDGLEFCDEFGVWSDCLGGVFPQPEICDGADNDCDGLFDEDLEGCDSPLECPGTETASPLSTLELDGARIYDGAYDSWTWEVFCPITVDICPEPDDPSAQDTEIYIISSGSYRVRATIEIEGEIFTCEYTVVIGGDGLRVELTWDTQGNGNGNTDVDLHLHRPGTETNFHTGDDCYYANCKGSIYTIDWGISPTLDLTACENAPHGEGAEWSSIGFCANPRLDMDVIFCNPSVVNASLSTFCAPENINVDNPEPGEPYRIMVHYFSNSSYTNPTHPTVNVYCGGGLRATFGDGEVALTHGGNFFNPFSNDNWIVADVAFFTDMCGVVDCEIRPIDDDGEPWIRQNGNFGPPWSF